LGGGGATDQSLAEETDLEESRRLMRSAEATTPVRNLGRRVVVNGLAAYAVCQAWGNTPTAFDTGAGAALLSSATAFAQTEASIDIIAPYVVPPAASPMRADGVLTQAPNPISWHFALNLRAFSILFLDGRTKRMCPGNIAAPILVAPSFMSEQIGRAAVSSLFVVVAPGPVIGLERIEWLQQLIAGSDRAGRLSLDFEAWAFARQGIPSLLGELANHAPINYPADRHQQRVVFLSGDVHYSSSIRALYRATTSFGATDGKAADVAIAQLTSSSLRNQEFKTRFISWENPSWALLPGQPVTVLGYNNPNGSSRKIGVQVTATDSVATLWDVVESGTPIVVEARLEASYETPDWTYEVECMSDERSKQDRAPFYVAPPATAGDPAQRKLQGAQARVAAARTDDGRGIVGLNNLGAVTFRSLNGQFRVVHEVWWRPDDAKEEWATSRFEVPLTFETP
jgi:hypothetical protein